MSAVVYKINGRTLTEEEFRSSPKCRNYSPGAPAIKTYFNTPKKSGVFGVHPKQAKDEERRLADLGCPTKVLPDGDVLITSLKHEDKLYQVNGMEPLRDR